MATKIFNTDTNEVVELQVLTDGQDFLAEVIGGCDQEGKWASEDMPDSADFAMSDIELSWWERWAEREQRIIDKSQEMGEDAINAIVDLVDLYGSDMEALQDAEEEFLGI